MEIQTSCLVQIEQSLTTCSVYDILTHFMSFFIIYINCGIIAVNLYSFIHSLSYELVLPDNGVVWVCWCLSLAQIGRRKGKHPRQPITGHQCTVHRQVYHQFTSFLNVTRNISHLCLLFALGPPVPYHPPRDRD